MSSRTTKPAFTLTRGDVVIVPGYGPRQVGRVEQLRYRRPLRDAYTGPITEVNVLVWWRYGDVATVYPADRALPIASPDVSSETELVS